MWFQNMLHRYLNCLGTSIVDSKHLHTLDSTSLLYLSGECQTGQLGDMVDLNSKLLGTFQNQYSCTSLAWHSSLCSLKYNGHGSIHTTFQQLTPPTHSVPRLRYHH